MMPHEVMATVAENPQMKELTRTAKAIPSLIVALLGYVCAVVSVYAGGGWAPTKSVLVLTGILGGFVLTVTGAISAFGSVYKAEKADANKEKLDIADRALSRVFNSLDMDSDIWAAHISEKDLIAKLLRRIESTKKTLGEARNQIDEVGE